jgi:hypothetical protein
VTSKQREQTATPNGSVLRGGSSTLTLTLLRSDLAIFFGEHAEVQFMNYGEESLSEGRYH